MKIGIIGSGFTGLSAAYFLQKSGYAVEIFERDKLPGGLAIGFEEKDWNWSLEKHYHHFFTNDNAVLNLAKEIDYPIIIKRPKTSVLLDGTTHQFDSPLKLLTFNRLNVRERIRMAITLAFLRYNPFWKIFEPFTTTAVLKKFMGKNAYKTIWEPQMSGKFGNYKNIISLAWFWARIKKRTASLAYPEKGFLALAQAIEQKINLLGGKINYNTEIIQLDSKTKNTLTYTKQGITKTQTFDKIIVTLPGFLFKKIAPGLPKNYIEKLDRLEGIGAINLVLRLKKPFLKDSTYWLSICERDWPIMAIVEHTNYMDKKNYNNEHIVYLGKYLPSSHNYFKIKDEELLKIYDPYLKKLNKDYKKNLISYHVFKSPFAQPIIPTNYSKIMPPFETPLKNVYLSNIQQVYPWDRGTNYAVELGEKIAKTIIEENDKII